MSMQCPDENTLVAFAHRLLAAHERITVDSHLRGCPECRQVIALLAEARSTPAPQLPRQEAPASGADEPLPLLPERTLSPGTQLGRYILLRPLGVGGMGVVYAAYDSELSRTIALKLLRERQTPSEEARARLQREARAMARLTSPFVLPVYDAGSWNEQVFVTLELVEGGTLTQWLAQRPRSWREVLRAFLDAGRGLAAAHAAGLVHRDFKPDNVLVGADGRIRVTDFGLARSTEAPELPPGARLPTSARPHESTLTQQGVLVGTPAYMSPEQRKGLRADARSDQFSFCVALYEGLYGERPFGDDKEGKVRPPPPRTRVPAWLRRVVLRGLSADPQQRFGSMEALLSALQDDPGVRHRRWVLGAGALGLVLVVSGVTHQLSERRSLICKGAERKLEGIWDAAVRQKAEAAFLATREPHAAKAWKTTATGLDQHAAQWVGAHIEACEATRVRGEQSEQALDLRMECLERRRQELRALTRLMAEADSPLVDRALSAVQELTSVAGCEDVEALRTRPSLPQDEPQRSRAKALIQTLAEVGALHNTGRFKRGLELAEQALKEAREIGFAPLKAEALANLGQMQERLGKEEDAEKMLTEAVLTAHAAGRPDLAVDGYLHLAWATQKRPEVALSWLRFASALIQATGDKPTERAHLLHNEGFILLEQGQPLEAYERLQQAAVLMERALGPDSLKLAQVLGNAAAVLNRLERSSEALVMLQRALAIREENLGPDDPNLVPNLHTLVGIQLSRGEGASALEPVKRALAIVERALGPEHPWRVILLNSLGRALAMEGRDAEAWETYQRGVALEEKLHGPDSVEGLRIRGNMSRLRLRQGRHAEALAYAESALQALQKRLGPEHDMTAFFMVDVGNGLRAQGKPAQALEFIQRALPLIEKSRGQESPDVGSVLTGLGRALVDLGQSEQALAPLERALRLLKEARSDDVATTQFALAQALTAAKEDSIRARTLAEEAREGFRKAGPRASRALAEVEAWLARHAPATGSRK